MRRATVGFGWAVPGGGVDHGETTLDAALRELIEESRPTASRSQASEMSARYVPDLRASPKRAQRKERAWPPSGLWQSTRRFSPRSWPA